MSTPAARQRRGAVLSFVHSPTFTILLGVLAAVLTGVSAAKGNGSDALVLGLLAVLGTASGLLAKREAQRGSAYGGPLGVVARVGRADPWERRNQSAEPEPRLSFWQGAVAVVAAFGAAVGLIALLGAAGVSEEVARLVAVIAMIAAWSWIDRVSADR